MDIINDEKSSAWLERGKKLIYPQRNKDWEKVVSTGMASRLLGACVEAALEVMEAIDKNVPIEQIKEIVTKHDNAGVGHARTMEYVLYFSKKGSEVYEMLEKDIQKESRKVLNSIKAANSRFESELDDIKQ